MEYLLIELITIAFVDLYWSSHPTRINISCTRYMYYQDLCSWFLAQGI
jgi:hypothetical protein